MMKLRIMTFCGMMISLMSAQAYSAIVTYSGFEPSPGGTVSPTEDAFAARTDFLSALSGGVGTEDFESFMGTETSPYALTFPGSTGSITATLSGTNLDLRTSGNVGGFATSGSKYLEATTSTATNEFVIDFSSSIAAFGFYATDLGDSGGGDVVLTLMNGTTETLTIPVTGLQSGNLLFYGFVSDSDQFTSISFSNTGGTGDVWGFDDMTIGDIGQVNSAVPEPTSMALWGLGSLGFGALVRRRKRKQE